jgi:hypothetical protein
MTCVQVTCVFFCFFLVFGGLFAAAFATMTVSSNLNCDMHSGLTGSEILGSPSERALRTKDAAAWSAPTAVTSRKLLQKALLQAAPFTAPSAPTGAPSQLVQPGVHSYRCFEVWQRTRCFSLLMHQCLNRDDLYHKVL